MFWGCKALKTFIRPGFIGSKATDIYQMFNGCTSLESVDLTGKTVIPFFSHEGSSNGAGALPTIEKLADGAEIRTDDALSIRGGSVDGSEQQVRTWVKDLGFSNK